MTRWARVGSTQKHHKIPGDSTPWEELSKGTKKNSPPKHDKINRIQKGRIEKKKHNLNMGGSKKLAKSVFQAIKKYGVKDLVKSESVKGKMLKNKKLPNTDDESDESQDDVDQNPFADLEFMEDEKEKIDQAGSPGVGETANGTGKALTKSQKKRAAKKRKKMEEIKAALNMSENEVAELAEDAASAVKKKPSKKRKNRQEIATVNEDVESESDIAFPDEVEEGNKKQKSVDIPVKAQSANLASFINKDHKSAAAATTRQKTMTKKQMKIAKRAKKLAELKAKQSQETDSEEDSNEKESATPLDKDFLNKKQMLLEKLEKKKPRDGAFVLPSRVERKIYNIKRKLMDNGMSPKIIADIIQKETKREEEKFKKTFATKPCFNCREIGHLLSDCPLPLGNSTQETGLCFKCGSKGHVSYKCPKKVVGYPLAKCFVCKEQGHISKDCPKNAHGVYIKGGKCGRCGNVNHLRKDCPSDRKNKKDEVVLTVGTINEGRSVDEEILEPAPKKSKKKFNKPKVVKF